MIKFEDATEHLSKVLRNKISDTMYEYTYNGYNIRGFIEGDGVRIKITKDEKVIKNYMIVDTNELANQLMKIVIKFT